MTEVILTILMILLVPLGLFLIAIILLQESKSGGLSSAFGGSGESILGARAGRELSRWTMWGTLVFTVVLIAVGILCNIRQRHDALLAEKGLALDQASFAREAALLAERADVTEEVERLRSHCAQMRDALAAGGEAGRRLDFIAQEMLREAATMGAKIGSHALAEKIIHLKVQIDRLKEQAQNIE